MTVKLSGLHFRVRPFSKLQRKLHLAIDQGISDILQFSRFVTLHFQLVENIQQSFKCFGLVFASQADKLLFCERRKSVLCGRIGKSLCRNKGAVTL